MVGKYINKQQVELYMKKRKQKGLTQETSAAQVGISVRSGRTIEKGKHYSSSPKLPRQYKTRRSELDEVWENDLKGMLEKNPDLQPKTLFIYLQNTYKDASGQPIYSCSLERTLQRRVRQWRAMHGPDREVMFPQEHLPGEQGLSDFTEFKDVKITIQGEAFSHRFYHFRLVFSHWSYLKVIQTGESLQALSEGLQEALWELGGAPQKHRTDSLSAAFKNVSRATKEDLTEKYQTLCQHYGMTPTRNNKGKKHENGSVESSHGHLKNRLRQALILRGSHDFESVEAYEIWVKGVVKQFNQHNTKRVKEEKSQLTPLPTCKTSDYELHSVNVSTFSIITVKGMRYSLPSRLIGHTVTIHIYQQTLQVYLGSEWITTLERCYKKTHTSGYSINYRDVIHSLSKKPRAFRYCRYREALLPNETYRKIWHYIDQTESPIVAAKLMVRLLKLAADHACEKTLGDHVMSLIHEKKPLLIAKIESELNTSNPPLPEPSQPQHELSDYDQFIQGGLHANI